MADEPALGIDYYGPIGGIKPASALEPGDEIPWGDDSEPVAVSDVRVDDEVTQVMLVNGQAWSTLARSPVEYRRWRLPPSKAERPSIFEEKR